MSGSISSGTMHRRQYDLTIATDILGLDVRCRRVRFVILTTCGICGSLSVTHDGKSILPPNEPVRDDDIFVSVVIVMFATECFDVPHGD